MNQAERKYFLKKFFSFNANSSTNSSNGSIDEIKMNILQRNSPHPAILLNTDSIETDFLLQSSASTTPLMASNQFNLLQQQNSLELKPFKKKEAQIEDDSNTAMNSFKTDITFLDNQSVTSPAANQQQLKLYQQIFKLPNNGIYNKLRYKLVCFYF